MVSTPSGVRFGKKQREGSHPAFSFSSCFFLHSLGNECCSSPQKAFFFPFLSFSLLILMVEAEPGAHSSVVLMVQAPCLLPAAGKGLFKGKRSFSGVFSTSSVVDASEDNWAGAETLKIRILLNNQSCVSGSRALMPHAYGGGRGSAGELHRLRQRGQSPSILKWKTNERI